MNVTEVFPGNEKHTVTLVHGLLLFLLSCSPNLLEYPNDTRALTVMKLFFNETGFTQRRKHINTSNNIQIQKRKNYFIFSVAQIMLTYCSCSSCLRAFACVTNLLKPGFTNKSSLCIAQHNFFSIYFAWDTCII